VRHLFSSLPVSLYVLISIARDLRWNWCWCGWLFRIGICADWWKGPGCSNSHIPGFMNHPKVKEAGGVFVVAVNDPFV
jgi:hypothetical protein